MKLVDKKITNEELKQMSEKMFDHLVKAVVDIEKEIMVVDAGLHVDEEFLLLEQGSEQKNLWGINIYPARTDEGWIVFDSMINTRPPQNRTRGVDNPVVREKIIKIVSRLVER